MDLDIANLVVQDGIASGAIYAIMALGIVLVFNSTRVIFVSFGDLVAYAALTMGTLQQMQTPGTIWLVGLLACLAFVTEAVTLLRTGQGSRIARACLVWLVVPMIPVAATLALGGQPLPWLVQLMLSIALILPLGPLLYRVVFQPAADAPVLVLLMISVALHFALSGLALLGFGPEGLRTRPFLPGDVDLGRFSISGPMLVMIAAAVVLSIILFLFFNHTFAGKALRATAMNRDGARLVGIRTTRAGAFSFLLAAGIAAFAGILISPTTTIYYDTGLMVGLKGFVGATVGGFIGYPASVAGALIIGLIESFSSFYVSAFKDVIVFGSIIPIVLWRWLASDRSAAMDEEVEE
jgi:branched-chain amino acid transport system permease protein